MYAFGITALELINGVTPYHEWPSMQILLNKLDSPLPPITSVRRPLSTSFFHMVKQCVDKDPSRRYGRGRARPCPRCCRRRWCRSI